MSDTCKELPQALAALLVKWEARCETLDRQLEDCDTRGTTLWAVRQGRVDELERAIIELRSALSRCEKTGEVIT